MCGIAGVVTSDRPIADAPALARRLAEALAHRGPDGEGVWTSPASNVLLVHRRLAIIDVGPSGAQPMATPNLRHHLIFNGEIYNYRELRRELEARGERFATASDTEVLLVLIAREGPAALARVRGMFALACWDAVDRSLLLARDRFGIKPLYVAATPSGIAFASELAALGAAGLADTTPSAAGVLAFLTWGSVPPPLTWRRGVEMLAPGTWRIRRIDGREAHGVFADTRDAYRSDRRHPLPEAAFREVVGEAVRDSVRAHLIADVPVGVFLSGGIDSSAIVSASVSAGASALQTFTVTFDDPTSEAGPARAVADAFGTRHRELRVDAASVATDLPDIVARLDQPTIDAVNSFYVARAVAATGIKAVLSGTGGDELFGGYPSFTRLPRAAAAKAAMGPLLPWIAPVMMLGGLALPPRLRQQWRHFVASNGRFAEAYRAQRGFVLPRELDALAGPALRDASVWHDAREQVDAMEHALLEPAADESRNASVARLESRLYLCSQLLRDIDVMAMAHGLEVRVPFVDHELLGAVWPELGFHPSLLTHKRLLYETLDRKLPEGIVDRPKQGFILPFRRWIAGELAPFVRDGLQQLASAGWIRPGAPDRVWADWRGGVVHWTRPWGLSVLGHFLAATSR
jgi:asparagine synthase (glutamine-hydrolysing)